MEGEADEFGRIFVQVKAKIGPPCAVDRGTAESAGRRLLVRAVIGYARASGSAFFKKLPIGMMNMR